MTARAWLEQISLGMPYFRGMGRFPRPTAFTDDQLRSIDAPTLLIKGEEEPMHDPHTAIARASALMAIAMTALLPNTRHVAELEQPERVNQLVLKHLADHE